MVSMQTVQTIHAIIVMLSVSSAPKLLQRALLATMELTYTVGLAFLAVLMPSMLTMLMVNASLVTLLA